MMDMGKVNVVALVTEAGRKRDSVVCGWPGCDWKFTYNRPPAMARTVVDEIRRHYDRIHPDVRLYFSWVGTATCTVYQQAPAPQKVSP